MYEQRYPCTYRYFWCILYTAVIYVFRSHIIWVRRFAVKHADTRIYDHIMTAAVCILYRVIQQSHFFPFNVAVVI